MPTYNENYFRGSYVPTPEPGGYDDYSDHTYYDETAAILADRFMQKALANGINLTGKKVLICGCAYGFLVKYLIALGVGAYGVDISAFAISQAPPEIASRVMVGDVRLDATLTAAKQMAGITGNKKFDVIFGEDIIPCFTDAEAIAYCTRMRNGAGLSIHFLTDSAHLSQWYNYHTLTQWKALCDPQNRDRWYARFTWSEV